MQGIIKARKTDMGYTGLMLIVGDQQRPISGTDQHYL